MTNEHDFVGLDHLSAHYKVEVFGDSPSLLTAGILELPLLPAGQSAKLPLPDDILQVRNRNECWLTVTFSHTKTTAWAEAGHVISQFQFPLSAGLEANTTVPKTGSARGEVRVRTSSLTYKIETLTSTFEFDHSSGHLTHWTSNGQSVLMPSSNTRPLAIGFWRAPTDNDAAKDSKYWRQYGLDVMTSQLRSFDIPSPSSADENAVLTTKTYLSPPILAWGLEATTVYTISKHGGLSISVHLKSHDPFPKTMPRIGLDVQLDPAYDQAAWFGLGPGESYLDKQASQLLGIYNSATSELQSRYDVPQENGNRCGTRWVKLLNGQGSGIKATYVPGPRERQHFQWSAQRYDPEVLEKARHPCDLAGQGRAGVLWRLQCDNAGVGSAACGPGVDPRWQVECRERKFEFVLEPAVS